MLHKSRRIEIHGLKQPSRPIRQEAILREVTKFPPRRRLGKAACMRSSSRGFAWALPAASAFLRQRQARHRLRDLRNIHRSQRRRHPGHRSSRAYRYEPLNSTLRLGEATKVLDQQPQIAARSRIKWCDGLPYSHYQYESNIWQLAKAAKCSQLTRSSATSFNFSHCRSVAWAVGCRGRSGCLQITPRRVLSRAVNYRVSSPNCGFTHASWPEKAHVSDRYPSQRCQPGNS